jgi:hypothetical protein
VIEPPALTPEEKEAVEFKVHQKMPAFREKMKLNLWSNSGLSLGEGGKRKAALVPLHR